MKLLKFLGASIILISLLVSCSLNHNQTGELSSIDIQELTSISSTEYTNKGYDRQYSTEHANYFFPADTDWDEKELILKSEMILVTLLEEYNLKPMTSNINICFNEDAVRYTEKTKASYVELDPNELNTGILAYFISGGKFPAWLCCGLEVNCLNRHNQTFDNENHKIDLKTWAQEADLKRLPSLGDEWFIPGIIEDDLSNSVITVAGKFVEFLEANGQLPELMQCYIYDKWKEAETLRKESWEKSTGIQNESYDQLVFHYMINQYSHSYFEEDLLFYVQGQEGTYYYSAAPWWDYEKVIDYVTTGESSISYTENWLGYAYNGLLDVYYLVPVNSEAKHGQFYDRQGNRIYSYVTNEKQAPIGIAHEVVHAIIRISGLRTLGFDIVQSSTKEWFEEALCTTISTLYQMETEDAIVARNAYLYSLHCLRAYCGDDCALQYLLTVISQNGDANRLDAVVFSDLVAITFIDQMKLEEKALSTGSRVNYMSEYNVAPSFILYLLEKRGEKEQFMQVYQDISSCEEIYGMQLDDLIYEWICYLNKYR